MRYIITPLDALAYFVFRPRQGIAEDCITCLRSLVAQLKYASSRYPMAIRTSSSRWPFSGHAAEGSALLKDLQSLVSSQRRTFIILDGIDEAQDQEGVSELLSILANKGLKNLHLFISSRPETINTLTLDPMTIATLGIEGRVINEDIAIYIEHYFHISSTTKTWVTSLKCETKARLVNEADGRYVAYDLQVQLDLTN